MRLLNYTTTYFAGLLLVLVAIWALFFYYNIINVFRFEIDEGLVNQKQLIIDKVKLDSSLLRHYEIAEGNFSIQKTNISPISNKDVYLDTMLFMPAEGEAEPVRLLKTVFSIGNEQYLLTVAASTVEQEDVARHIFYKLLWLYFGLIASILVLNNILLKKAWKPFYSLLSALENFSFDNPRPIIAPKTTIDEFKLLNDTVQKMVQNNLDIFHRQKQFIENASHELQTPLAIGLNKLETLAGAEVMSDDGIRLLTDAINNLERLTRLNKSLLLLTKISNNQFETIAVVNINNLVEEAKRNFSDQLNFSNVTIAVEHQETCYIEMNVELARVLINNLIKNAIVHNISHGSIDIIISSRLLLVGNTGKPGSLNKEKVFSRFYKEGESSTSTGLGLSIVKAIADLYAFKVSYRYDNKHIITINFKED